MKPGLIRSALLLRRNIIALIATYAALYVFWHRLPFIAAIAPGAPTFSQNSPILWGVTLAVYIGFVTQSLFSREFRETYKDREMINGIKRSQEECRTKAKILKRKLELKAQTRLDNILKETDEIVQSFLSGDKNYLKVRVVQQSLNLTANYIKLADMFRVRASASGGDKISSLARRINANTSNLNSVRDQGIAGELKRVIEADEKMIESLKNERLELEKIDARLQYMESTISMLKYNIISNLESDDILSTLESDVSEASALNSVLSDRYDERREERRLRL